MEPRDTQFTFDCVDPARQAAFWAEALGYRVAGPTTRVRLVGRGARGEAVRLARHQPSPPMGAGHIVMADPEGNEFYVA